MFYSFRITVLLTLYQGKHDVNKRIQAKNQEKTVGRSAMMCRSRPLRANGTDSEEEGQTMWPTQPV
jgi:hypothetical protein